MKKTFIILAAILLLAAGCNNSTPSVLSENIQNSPPNNESTPNHDEPREPDDDCKIKGNISQTSGEKIYHLPGGQFYDRTEIHTSYGERWFCSESEAEEAGWRASQK